MIRLQAQSWKGSSNIWTYSWNDQRVRQPQRYGAPSARKHGICSPRRQVTCKLNIDGNSMKFDLTSCGITTLVAILSTMCFDDLCSEFNPSSCSYPSRWTQVQSSALNSHRWIHFEFQFKADTRARIRDFCWSRWTSYRTTVPLMSCRFTFVHVISPT